MFVRVVRPHGKLGRVELTRKRWRNLGFSVIDLRILSWRCGEIWVPKQDGRVDGVIALVGDVLFFF